LFEAYPDKGFDELRILLGETRRKNLESIIFDQLSHVSHGTTDRVNSQ
jgi:hypothetical protein